VLISISDMVGWQRSVGEFALLFLSGDNLVNGTCKLWISSEKDPSSRGF